MKRSYSLLVLIGLLAAFGLSVMARGGNSRIFWPWVAALLGLLTGGFLIRLNHARESVRFNPRTDLALLGFLGWAVFSSFFSINREESFNEVLRLCIPVTAYFLAAYALSGDEWKKALVFGLAGLVLLEAVFGLFELVSGRSVIALLMAGSPGAAGRAYGTFVNANHFAGLMEMGIFLSFGIVTSVSGKGLESQEQAAQKIIVSLLSGVMILGLIMSLSRGGWASFMAGLLFFVALFWRHDRLFRPRVLVMVLAVLLLLGAFVLKVNRASLSRRISSLEALYNQREITRHERLTVWKSALDMVRARPLTGTGPGTFKTAFPAYRRDRLFYGFAFAHNDYLQIAAGFGIPGLALFLLFVFMVFKQGFLIVRSGAGDFQALIMPGVLAAMFAILIHEMVDFNLMITSNSMLFFSLAGVVAGRGGASG